MRFILYLFTIESNSTIPEKRVCLECGQGLHGRSDQKYCSDMCRNSYNNKVNSLVNNYVRNVNNALKRNRRILIELNPRGKIKIEKSKLVAAGFNFNYYTNIYTTKSGNVYYFCYEQGYLELEGDFFALVVKQEYM